MTEESDNFAKEEKLEIEGLSDFEFASNIEKIWEDMTLDKWKSLSESEKQRIKDWRKRTRPFYRKLLFWISVLLFFATSISAFWIMWSPVWWAFAILMVISNKWYYYSEGEHKIKKLKHRNPHNFPGS